MKKEGFDKLIFITWQMEKLLKESFGCENPEDCSTCPVQGMCSQIGHMQYLLFKNYPIGKKEKK